MNDPEEMRHSLSHIMAQAVLDIYPKAKLAIGPAISDGFYYDLDLDEPIKPEDLKKIEKKMQHIIKQDQIFEKHDEDIDEAIKRLKKEKAVYKLEMAKEKKEEGAKKLRFYRNYDRQGNLVFEDMCMGPHVESTGKVGAFKLDRLAGAYWRGNEKNKMLQRIYGLAFWTKKELEDHLKMRQEAEKRDHRKLGKELELFVIDPQVGLGLPMWLPKGALLWRVMEDFWYAEHLKNGYDLVRTPHIGSRQLWETSGHWGFYNSSMYPPIEVGQSLEEAQKGKKAKIKEEYLLKPMNCPFHVRIYKALPKSYRDLPIRWAECGTVYRYEKSGEISGLMRVRGFTQDDAHIICAADHVEKELEKVVDFISYMLSTFGFKEYNVYLSMRDPKDKKKYAGNDKGWAFTEMVLEKVAKKKKLNYTKELGEAAFYGPKLDFKIKDCLGREWQCSTLQFDFNLPERIDMTYINEKGKEERPYMLHRALFGSFERFIGVMIEHYAGAFPVWLCPEQVRLVPVGADHIKYCRELAAKLKEEGLRVNIDELNETVGNKIRKAAKDKVPYMLVIGDKEMDGKKINVRIRGKKDTEEMSLQKFIEYAKEAIAKKKLI